jgi:hypothetical protein
VSFGTEVFRSLEIGLKDLEETRMSLSAFSMGSACDVFIQARMPRKTVENRRVHEISFAPNVQTLCHS